MGPVEQLAAVDHHHVVAHPLHVVEQVGGDEHRDAEAGEAPDEAEHLLAAERVEPGGGLVEEDELRVGDEGLGELGALAHAGGEAADRPEAGFVEADQVEHLRRPLAGGPGWQTGDLAEVDTASAADWSSGRQSCSGMNPRPVRTPTGSSATGRPATSMVPLVGRSSPRARRSRVVLPAPLAPTRPTEPRGTSMVRIVERNGAALVDERQGVGCAAAGRPCSPVLGRRQRRRAGAP